MQVDLRAGSCPVLIENFGILNLAGGDATKRKRYSDEQIAFALRQAENGDAGGRGPPWTGISEQTFYRWKKLHGGLGTGELRRLKQLEEENAKLKQLVADLSLDKHILQDVLSKKL